MIGPGGPFEILLLLLLGTGGMPADTVSLMTPEIYFKHRNIEITLPKMIELAGTTPKDGKGQLQQLLALRALGSMGAKVKADKKTMDLLQEIAEGKKAADPLGFAREYALLALDRLEGRPLQPPTMPKDSIRKDAFAWFPLGTNLVAAYDLRPIPGIKIESTEATFAKVVDKMMRRGEDKEKMLNALEMVGNVRLERIAMGLLPEPQQQPGAAPLKGRIYVRVSIKADHKRLVEAAKELAGDMFGGPGRQNKFEIRTEQGPKGEPITTMVIENSPPAFAIVGNTDVLIAGHADNAGNHLEVLQQMLAVRAGRSPSAAAGNFADSLKKINDNAFALVIGEIPEEFLQGLLGGGLGLGGNPNGQPPFRSFPKSIFVEVSRKQAGIDFKFEGQLGNAEDAKNFCEDLEKVTKQALDELKMGNGGRIGPGMGKMPKEAIDQVTKIVGSVKMEAKGTKAGATMHIPNAFIKMMPEMMMNELMIDEKAPPPLPPVKEIKKEAPPAKDAPKGKEPERKIDPKQQELQRQFEQQLQEELRRRQIEEERRQRDLKDREKKDSVGASLRLRFRDEYFSLAKPPAIMEAVDDARTARSLSA